MSINSRIWIGFSLSTHKYKIKESCTHAVYWVGQKVPLGFFMFNFWPTQYITFHLHPVSQVLCPFLTPVLPWQLTLGWCNPTSPQLSYTDYIAFCQPSLLLREWHPQNYTAIWACWQTCENEKVTPESHPCPARQGPCHINPFLYLRHLQLPMAVTSSIADPGTGLLSPLLSSSQFL